MTITIDADQRGLIVRTPYSAQFVSELKRLVPQGERQFDGTSKSWIVAHENGVIIQKLILSIYGEAVSLPVNPKVSAKLEGVKLRVEYVGQCKQRADGSTSAYGHDGSTWAVVLPETVLKAFFGSDIEILVDGDKNRPQAKPASLYAILLIRQDAVFSDIKSAYRRVARQWHPDVCREPDATERMAAIVHAYEILSNPVMRRRYDAGLALEASLVKKQYRNGNDPFYDLLVANYGQQGFRTPLRCGLLTVDGERKLGRVIVSRIHDWQDILDEQGRTLVTSWIPNGDTFERRWV